MSHYSIKNLLEVKDIAPDHGFSEVQAARFPREDLGAEATGLAYHAIKPGQHGFAHRHQDAEEIYVVLSGEGQIKLDDEVRDIGPMDAIRVAPGVARAFAAGSDGLELLAFGPHHAGDGEVLDGDPWAG